LSQLVEGEGNALNKFNAEDKMTELREKGEGGALLLEGGEGNKICLPQKGKG